MIVDLLLWKQQLHTAKCVSVNKFAPVTMRFINITRMIDVIVLRVGVLNENKRKNFALFNSYSGVQNQIELKV